MKIKEKIEEFQKTFNPLLSTAIDAVLNEQELFSPGTYHYDQSIRKAVHDYNATGKRIRPFIIASMSRRNLHDDDIKHACLAYELFHLMALIHDDIIDNSALRRGVPTIHTIFKESEHKHTTFGRDIAILLGDAFLVESLRYASLLGHHHYVGISRILKQTIRGQMLDVYGMNDQYGNTSNALVTSREELKTAWYTFAGPAERGLLLRETPLSDEDIKTITNVFISLGKLFQIRDDILDCDSKREDKKPFEDVIEGQTTWTTLFIKQHYREQFMKLVTAQNNNDIDAIAAVFSTIDFSSAYQDEYTKVEHEVSTIASIDDTSYEHALELLHFMAWYTHESA